MFEYSNRANGYNISAANDVLILKVIDNNGISVFFYFWSICLKVFMLLIVFFSNLNSITVTMLKCLAKNSKTGILGYI